MKTITQYSNMMNLRKPVTEIRLSQKPGKPMKITSNVDSKKIHKPIMTAEFMKIDSELVLFNNTLIDIESTPQTSNQN